VGTEDLLQQVHQGTLEIGAQLLMRAARIDNISDQQLLRLVQRARRGAPLVAANMPNCPSRLLWLLAREPGEQVRQAVADNPRCPLDLMKWMQAHDSSVVVMMHLARNPNCPLELLRKMAQDDDPMVQGAVGSNERCPPDLLRLLATHQRLPVRENVAANPQCPPDVLEALADDKYFVVPLAVARNPKCPVHLLVRFVNDDVPRRARQIALLNPSLPEEYRQLGRLVWQPPL
jgi:hypothetical protein